MASKLPLWRRKIPRFPPFFKDDPQRHVLLPQFWMKMLKPKEPVPPDMVHFEIHPQMSKADVKQYLEKIYHVDVLSVRTEIRRGFRASAINTRHRLPDTKLAYVQLLNEKFTFPSIELGTSQKNREKGAEDEEEEDSGKTQNTSVPSWFK